MNELNNRLRITDMAEHEKPVEKLIAEGAEYLSDSELLSIILRTGSNDMSVLELSQLILNAHPIYKGLAGLNYRYLNELMDIKGVGKVKASQILAVVEISRRISKQKYADSVSLNSSQTVADYFMEQTRFLTKERVYAVFSSTSHRYIHKILLSEGSMDRCLLSNRELFKEALRANAANIVLIHNHPSGDPEPSDIDVLHTKQIKKLGDEMGVSLLDHIIIGDGVYYSMAEHDLI